MARSLLRRLAILDTTLRDGEQAPGILMGPDAKAEVARRLELAGVDVIEAGFAASSPADFGAIRRISGCIRGSVVCALARACGHDIRIAARSLEFARRPRIHVFVGSSRLHMEDKLRMHEWEVLDRATAAVRLARAYCDDVEFSPEDSSRSDPSFLCSLACAAVEAGATIVNVTDTVGYGTPGLLGDVAGMLHRSVPSSGGVTLSVHCHNDVGLALANTIAAVVRGGAGQVECTVTGIGERAGNAALEEVVVATWLDHGSTGLDVRIDARHMLSLASLVSLMTRRLVHATKPVVGQHAFSHASGIHQDGVIKNRRTYEALRAEDIGGRGGRIVLGKLSGAHALRERLGFIHTPLGAIGEHHLAGLMKLLASRLPLIDGAALAVLHAIALRPN
ncbi:2-isopropylmalate synthase [Candidatus Tremblaya princeps]|uniref:2-isopropylmalate synthase n=2 Tax=Tremblaya princeps TaxID=189385 RepID=A0A143WNM0_TREPR|nr:2-isopropylmalate synthase [Candidatus Tremblaya princeps]